MKLFYGPGSCSLAPHIILQEIGKSFETERVDLQKKTTEHSHDYKKINPKGYVPALVLENGELLTEAAVILQYLADQNATLNLFPAWGGMERYRALEWLNFISTELHKGFSPLWNKTLAEDAKKIFWERLQTRFDIVEEHLQKNQFVLGKNFSVLDAYLFTVINWANFLKLDLKKWPSIQAYLSRVSERPAVKRALEAEGLLRAA